jgi:hypothetical protein
LEYERSRNVTESKEDGERAWWPMDRSHDASEEEGLSVQDALAEPVTDISA